MKRHLLAIKEKFLLWRFNHRPFLHGFGFCLKHEDLPQLFMVNPEYEPFWGNGYYFQFTNEFKEFLADRVHCYSITGFRTNAGSCGGIAFLKESDAILFKLTFSIIEYEAW